MGIFYDGDQSGERVFQKALEQYINLLVKDDEFAATFVGNNTSIHVSLTTGQSKVEDCDF